MPAQEKNFLYVKRKIFAFDLTPGDFGGKLIFHLSKLRPSVIHSSIKSEQSSVGFSNNCLIMNMIIS